LSVGFNIQSACIIAQVTQESSWVAVNIYLLRDRSNVSFKNYFISAAQLCLYSGSLM